MDPCAPPISGRKGSLMPGFWLPPLLLLNACQGPWWPSALTMRPSPSSRSSIIWYVVIGGGVLPPPPSAPWPPPPSSPDDPPPPSAPGPPPLALLPPLPVDDPCLAPGWLQLRPVERAANEIATMKQSIFAMWGVHRMRRNVTHDFRRKRPLRASIYVGVRAPQRGG